MKRLLFFIKDKDIDSINISDIYNDDIYDGLKIYDSNGKNITDCGEVRFVESNNVKIVFWVADNDYVDEFKKSDVDSIKMILEVKKNYKNNSYITDNKFKDYSELKDYIIKNYSKDSKEKLSLEKRNLTEVSLIDGDVITIWKTRRQPDVYITIKNDHFKDDIDKEKFTKNSNKLIEKYFGDELFSMFIAALITVTKILRKTRILVF